MEVPLDKTSESGGEKRRSYRSYWSLKTVVQSCQHSSMTESHGTHEAKNPSLHMYAKGGPAYLRYETQTCKVPGRGEDLGRSRMTLYEGAIWEQYDFWSSNSSVIGTFLSDSEMTAFCPADFLQMLESLCTRHPVQTIGLIYKIVIHNKAPTERTRIP